MFPSLSGAMMVTLLVLHEEPSILGKSMKGISSQRGKTKINDQNCG